MLDVVRSVVAFLGANNIVLAIVGLIGAPFVDRLLIRRRRITFRVLYNSKIGVGPENLHAHDDPANVRSAQLAELASVLDRMSIVVIRIRNSGSYEVAPEDFTRPLSFTFGPRIIWNARISDATDDELRAHVREGLEFFTPDEAPMAPAPGGSLGTLRELLPTRFRGEDYGPDWRGVRLGNLTLGRRQRFKLVVVLIEPPGHDDTISKTISHRGRLREGLIRDGKIERRITLPRVTGAAASMLALLLVVGALLAPAPSPASAGQAVGCAPGTLTIEGSSVFIPMMTTLAAQYERTCPGATISTRTTGSVVGVRDVEGLPDGTPDDLVALSDGRQSTRKPLHTEQLAIVVYHVAVNSSAGVDGLTTAQLQGIYQGTYRDWSQLRGGAPLPIRIVGRGQESGTRELFEQRVLHTGEPSLSSNECLNSDRVPDAPVIRCERDSNAEVVQKISHTPGAIGYADAPSIADARKNNAVTALTLDNKAFDINSGIESGYPFWTVEYLYSWRAPVPNTLLAQFLTFVQRNDSARVRLSGAGYVPCTTQDGAPLDLCNRR